nr:MAG TPA: hypothetical protein [Bacteriophage sp.]
MERVELERRRCSYHSYEGWPHSHCSNSCDI